MNTETKFVSSTALLAAAAAAGAPGVAAAADLVTKAPVHVPFTSWEGFYVGGSLGATWLKSDPDSLGSYGYTTTGTSSTGIGFLGGLQAGYNWQSRNFVYGLEGDLSFLGGGKATSDGRILAYGGYSASKSSQIQGLGTLRARFGMDFNGTMPYVTGGIAVGSIKHTYSDGYTGNSFSKTSYVPGLALGAGIEHQLSNRWTVKGELLWVGFQSTTLGLQSGYSTKFNDNLLTAKIGMNYRF